MGLLDFFKPKEDVRTFLYRNALLLGAIIGDASLGGVRRLDKSIELALPPGVSTEAVRSAAAGLAAARPQLAMEYSTFFLFFVDRVARERLAPPWSDFVMGVIFARCQAVLGAEFGVATEEEKVTFGTRHCELWETARERYSSCDCDVDAASSPRSIVGLFDQMQERVFKAHGIPFGFPTMLGINMYLVETMKSLDIPTWGIWRPPAA